jgi:SEC-C motif domain protein
VTCPCGSGLALEPCCGRWLAGEDAPTAEALMRSRYTAYVVRDRDHLLRTWHPSTRPRRLVLDDGPAWLRLVVLDTARGGLLDVDGEVEFRAAYEGGSLHERSRFVREGGRWLYVDGSVASGHG